MPKIAAPRYWSEQLPSGRWRARVRIPNGSTTSATFDYEYEADAWGTEAVRRATSAASAGRGEPAAAPPASDLTAVLEALRAAGIVPAEDAPADRILGTPRPLERPAAPTSPTVAEYAATFLAARRGHLSKNTHDGYEIQLRLGACAAPFADTPLDQVTREAVDEWISAMVEEEVGRPTINRRLKVLRIMLNYALDNDRLDRDPTRKIAYLATDLREFRVLGRDDLEEEARLLAQCETPEHRAQVLLALDAGLRWGEVAGLAVSAISGDYLTVRQVVERGTGKVRKFPKGKRARVVPMTARLREALAVVVLVAGVRGPNALLFSTIVGGEARPLDPHNWHRDFWRGATHRARLNRRHTDGPDAGKADRFHFHDLRHTYGTRLAADGVPRREIAELMGHADESTTAIYVHPGTDGRRLELVRAALEPADLAG